MIKTKIKRLHLKNTWTIARNSSEFKENVIISVEKDGAYGWGEAAPNIRYKEDSDATIRAIELFNQRAINIDLMQYHDVKKQIDKHISKQNCAKAAIDMAILDWVGKKMNMPVYKFLGLNPENSPISSFSIGIDTPEKMQQKIYENKFMPIYKIKLGAENDRDIITAIREVTDKPIRVDANEGWKDKEFALEQIKWLADMGVELVEQPMPSVMLKESIWLKENSPLPIFADESVMRAEDIAIIARAFDGINIKLMKAGGILEAIKMINIANSLNLKVMLGCMIETSLAITAAAQIAPMVDYLDIDGNLLIINDPYIGVENNNGKIIYNDLPGLGIRERD